MYSPDSFPEVVETHSRHVSAGKAEGGRKVGLGLFSMERRGRPAPKERVKLLEQRYANKLDLWTGLPLTAEDLFVEELDDE